MFHINEDILIMSPVLPSPLGGSPPVEVPLARAPLLRVIAQLQFAPIAMMDQPNPGAVANFQEALRNDYPFYEPSSEQMLQITVGPAGQSTTPVNRQVWRFLDFERNWRISLTSEAVSLEAMKYSSRSDFLLRWSVILAALALHIKPNVNIRVAMRYLNRIQEPEVADVVKLIKSDYLLPLFKTNKAQVRHSVSETALSVEEGEMLLRMGKLPKGGTVDPNVMEPIDSETFIIDIDVSSLTQKKFNPEELNGIFEGFAGRAYSVFRHVVTEEFGRVYR